MFSDPCLVKYCPKGMECIVTEDEKAECICQKRCPRFKKLICGSDGVIYNNYCHLHRRACLEKKNIYVNHFFNCTQIHKHKKNDKIKMKEYLRKEEFFWNKNNKTNSNYAYNDVYNSKNLCTPQDHEIMKDNLLAYNHAQLLAKDKKSSGKEYLMSIMFSHYDQNNDGALEREELEQISKKENLHLSSNGCSLENMLGYDDTDKNGRLDINEFYFAFSVSVISLDKSLETNHVTARVGDNVEIKCDVTGSPPPPIVWQRNTADLSVLNEEEVKVFSDGSLYLTKIQLIHAGNYTCHAQRNKDVMQTHVLSVHTVPEVKVTPKIQSKQPGEISSMFCHVVGEPFPSVEWLKNDEQLKSEIPLKYEVLGNGTELKINDIGYADTGAYMCQATNIGGVTRDISSLIVQDELTQGAPNEEKRFFSFHDWGISVHEPKACRLYHQILSTDIIPGTQEYVCGKKNIKCSWGYALNIANRYIYVAQPNKDRILIISKIQMVVVDVVITDKYPVELFYVAHLDQVWLLNWRSEKNIGIKTIQVIRDASQKKKHHTVHPEPIDGQFDLVRGLFIPDIQDLNHNFKYGYVTHSNQKGLYKLDLANMRYVKNVDLSANNCVPRHVQFSALYGYVIIECEELSTGHPSGQILLDYLTDSIISQKTGLFGKPHVSPDSRITVTLDREKDGVTLVVQQIITTGLKFLFDVKTTLNVSAITFYPSQTTHGYDLYASATDKEDILFLNLVTGKVEMITGVGKAMNYNLAEWDFPNRLIVASGVFGHFMVTPASEALFVINGGTRTVNCEIGGVVHARAVVWVTMQLQ
ncbi:conserved hypothetical protein [Pediculus humanus corporis]|uniref:Follistatin-related protein 5 n=1 Tax=Pediculus humanus subsp. corporis TaxID=121224 RepID=E0VKQ2_PEDHC|nr:uncharacterized protein Phum_PHUM268610 [Pediculus humanus corporis]EEB13958.1 conserved hypothetical protein [Pediculus humanus corporis]